MTRPRSGSDHPFAQKQNHDPFQGFFSNDPRGRGHQKGLLKSARVRRWMDVVGWGMEAGLYTYQRCLDSASGAWTSVDGRPFLMMSSYDYLGLLGHPALVKATVKAVERFGTGSGGVRLLTGTNELHRCLEEDIASFKEVEAALTFTSGYVANLAAVSSLVGPHDGVILDAIAHRSLVDACRVARVPFRFFAHNDMNSLEQLMETWSVRGHRLIIAEGVYSMDGDICPLPALIELKQKFGAYLMIDEAHALGVLGKRGRGINDHFDVPAQNVDVWMGTFSKAIPATGGYLAGSRALIAYLQHEAAPFMFSAAMSPPDTAAARTALGLITTEPWRRQTVMDRAAMIRHGLVRQGWRIGNSVSPIVPVLLGDEEQAWCVARGLEEAGILASAVVPPAVARGASRLRLCAMASHSPDDIEQFLQAMAALPESPSPGLRKAKSTKVVGTHPKHNGIHSIGMTRSANGVTCDVHQDIHEIDPREWDALVPADDLLATHRFTSACQSSRVAEERYWHVILRRSGRPVGSATICRMDVSLDLLSDGFVRRATKWGRKLRPGLLRTPVLFCGLPVSFGQSSMHLASEENDASVIRALTELMCEVADQEGVDLLCIKELTQREVDRHSVLSDLGFTIVPSLPTCSLPLRWSSMDEYVGALRSGYRRQLLHTLDIPQQDGLVVRTFDDVSLVLDDAYALYQNVMDRAQFQLERLNRKFFGELRTCFPNELSAISIERDGQSVATALLLSTGSVSTFLLAGLDYDANARSRIYPLLVVEAIGEALRKGAMYFQMGQTSYSLKTRLGCELHDRFLCLKHRHRSTQRLLGAAAPWLFPRTAVPPRRVFRG